MLAVGPSLTAVIPSAGTTLTDNQILHTAPTELTLRFDSAIAANSLFNGGTANIQVTRGGDHILGNGNDVSVAAGFLAPAAPRTTWYFASPTRCRMTSTRFSSSAPAPIR